MIVMMMAITPSLKASSRPLLIPQSSAARPGGGRAPWAGSHRGSSGDPWPPPSRRRGRPCVPGPSPTHPLTYHSILHHEAAHLKPISRRGFLAASTLPRVAIERNPYGLPLDQGKVAPPAVMGRYFGPVSAKMRVRSALTRPEWAQYGGKSLGTFLREQGAPPAARALMARAPNCNS